MNVLDNIASELRLVPGSKWTWLCSISPWLYCGTGLLAWLLTKCGLRDSVLMLVPLSAGLLLSVFAVFVAIPLWCVLVFSRKFRLAAPTHCAQALVFIFGWIVTLIIMSSVKPLPLPRWLD